MSRLSQKIRAIMDSRPDLTQRGLAEAMGLDPSAVNRLLHGRRNIMADEIPLIERYLGVSLRDDDKPESPAPYPRRGFAEPPPQTAALNLNSPERIPLLGVDLRRDHPLDWIARHPNQFGLAEAFAFLVPDDGMAPRYFKDEIAYIHPRRPPMVGFDCLIFTSDTAQKPSSAFLARLLGETDNRLTLRRFGENYDIKINRDRVRQLYAVIGRG